MSNHPAAEAPRNGVGLSARAVELVATHLDALAAILRERSLDEPAARDLIGGARKSAVLKDLISAGLLEERAGKVSVVEPEIVTAQIAIEVLNREQRELASLTELIADMPEFTRAWQLGHDPSEHPLQGEVAHDAESAMRRWFQLGARSGPMQSCAVAPDLSWIRNNLGPMMAAAPEFFTEGFSARYVFDPAALDNEDDRALINQLVDLGVEVRLSPRLPGWFLLERDAMACLPTTWGESAPEGIVFVYTLPIVAAVQSIFDALWRASSPYPARDRSWQTVLSLMAEGKTDVQIAEELGIGARAVRRRLTAAMEELGATSRFELGIAWAGRTS